MNQSNQLCVLYELIQSTMRTIWTNPINYVYYMNQSNQQLIHTLQTNHVYSTLKQRGNDRFHVVSTWNTRGVFAGYEPIETYQTLNMKSNIQHEQRMGECINQYSDLHNHLHNEYSTTIPLDILRKLNLYKMLRRRPGCVMYVAFTYCVNRVDLVYSKRYWWM